MSKQKSQRRRTEFKPQMDGKIEERPLYFRPIIHLGDVPSADLESLRKAKEACLDAIRSDINLPAKWTDPFTNPVEVKVMRSFRLTIEGLPRQIPCGNWEAFKELIRQHITSLDERLDGLGIRAVYPFTRMKIPSLWKKLTEVINDNEVAAKRDYYINDVAFFIAEMANYEQIKQFQELQNEVKKGYSKKLKLIEELLRSGMVKGNNPWASEKFWIDAYNHIYAAWNEIPSFSNTYGPIHASFYNLKTTVKKLEIPTKFVVDLFLVAATHLNKKKIIFPNDPDDTFIKDKVRSAYAKLGDTPEAGKLHLSMLSK